MTNDPLYISLGSNQGDSVSILKQAYTLIENALGKIEKRSAFYETVPWGFEADQSFINSVIRLKTDQEPIKVLKKLQQIEKILGRKPKTKTKYESRLIDLDIISYGKKIVQTEDFELPHPRLHLRGFVLYPLQEIEPQWIHPSSGKRIEQLISELSDELDVTKIEIA